MAKRKKASPPPRKDEPIPPGATKEASDRQLPTNTPSDVGDRHAAGTPAGGTAIGGLAGTNVGHGDPDDVDLERAFGNSGGDEDDSEEPDLGYGGPSGGAVGGTPAGKRSRGGQTHHGFSPGGGSHRGDSTIGADPDAKTE
jgi:hypothetical protein